MKGTGWEGSSFDQVGRGEQTATTWPVCTRYAGGLAGLAGQPSQDSGRNSLELCRFYSMTAGPPVPVRLFCWSYLLVWHRFPVGGPVARPWTSSLSGFCPRRVPRIPPASCGERCTAEDHYEPLGSDGMWTKRGPTACGERTRRSASRPLPAGQTPPAGPP
jgi:hypothetical protein